MNGKIRSRVTKETTEATIILCQCQGIPRHDHKQAARQQHHAHLSKNMIDQRGKSGSGLKEILYLSPLDTTKKLLSCAENWSLDIAD